MTPTYPLAWPEGWPRTPSSQRKRGRFGATFGRSRDMLMQQFRLMNVPLHSIVVSSWLPLRRDGLPYGEQARRLLDDPGVAVYFTLRGRQMVMARDAYDTVFDNLHSLKIAIEHLRGLERHGGATMMERAFEGFAALPEPGNAGHRRPWWKALDFEAKPSRSPTNLDAAEQAYRRKARGAHPDMTTGSHEAMAELNAAIKKAREALQ